MPQGSPRVPRRRTPPTGDVLDRALGACQLSPGDCVLRHVTRTSRAVVAAYDGVTVQLLLDGDLQAARSWLTQLLTALLNR